MPADTPKTKGVFTPASGSTGGVGEAPGTVGGVGEGVGDGTGEAPGEGVGDGTGEAHTQSASSIHSGLTHLFSPPTVIHLKPDSQSASSVQSSKQAIKPVKFKVTSHSTV